MGTDRISVAKLAALPPTYRISLGSRSSTDAWILPSRSIGVTDSRTGVLALASRDRCAGVRKPSTFRVRIKSLPASGPATKIASWPSQECSSAWRLVSETCTNGMPKDWERIATWELGVAGLVVITPASTGISAGTASVNRMSSGRSFPVMNALRISAEGTARIRPWAQPFA